MRLLHVVPTYLPARRYGGPVVAVHGLCRALAARGHEVHVFTTSVDGPRDSDVVHGRAVALDGVQVHYFRSRWLRRLYWSPAMGAALRAHVASADVVHLHSVFLWPTTAAAAASRRHRVPYVLSPRGMLAPRLMRRRSRLKKRAWLAAFERRNLEGAALLHATSQLECDELRALGMRIPDVAVVPNGVEPAAAPGDAVPGAPIAALAARRDLVLYLGRLSWKKRVDRLLGAVARVPDAHLVVAGGDDEGHGPVLRRRAADLGIASRTSFVGEVHGGDKAALLAAARVLVLASEGENFGNVVAEAMAAGLPVVVTPQVGIAPLVTQARAGLVVPGEEAALAAALREILDHPGRARELGEGGRRFARERLGWDAIAAAMERRYDACRAGDALAVGPAA